ncbi:MAG: alkaline phosphatase family protein [Cyclobacteriaceae bacterium]|nr:alkaline phosphatase family protein [Cyclobacteriaceae bacterium]
MKRLVLCLLISFPGYAVLAQDQPKLVVGIVVDQMRQEYLYRYESKFGTNGFNRLVQQGFMLKNAHYNYVPTETGPGHASIYTGTTPAIHGIVANDWYDRTLKKDINCVGDDQQTTVGSERGGKVSPARLLSTTITDELKLATQKRAKVVGVSIKDRSAVLPSGHMADGAYWYDGSSGNFITSTYYKTALPDWVQKFNQRKLPEQYLSQEWTTLLPLSQYTEVGPDESPYEWKWRGKEKAVFPYKLNELRKDNGNYDLVGNTPWGNTLIAEMAKAAIAGEGMGKDDITDFLTVSFSSTDRIGHGTGPNSIELADTYLRLDKTLEDFFSYLDKEVGVGKYTVFLTADHGVAEVAQYLKDNRVPAGYFRPSRVEATLNEYLQQYFPGKTVVEKVTTEQVYINQQAFDDDPRASGIDLLIATELITKYLLATEGIAQVYTAATIRQINTDETGIRGKVIRGFNPKRCGDIAFVLEPGWYSWGGITGSTHGSAYTYDTHIPIVFYGAGIKKGYSSQYHTITDIAPTLSVLLKIKFPSGATGQPVTEILD